MITFTTGDILASDAEALVNTVNCVGIMGRGIALQFKNAFPSNFKAYEAACHRGEVQPGLMFVHELRSITGPKYIINFPTKRHWRGKSRIEDVDSGLSALVDTIQALGIRSIAIPPLGSGLGGLNWADVRPRIEAALSGIADLVATIYEPDRTSDARAFTKSRDVPAMSPGRAALVVLMNRYLGGLMDPFVTLLEVHKLMYFMQETGQPLRLKYTKAPYGPYAENLRHVLTAIEGHLINGYVDGGDDPTKQLTLVPGAVPDAESFLKDDQDTRSRFDRVGTLVEGFETPFGLELLATVHWVASQEGSVTQADAVTRVHNWNPRKKQFSPRQIGIALEALASKGWLPQPPSAGASTLLPPCSLAMVPLMRPV